MTTDQAAMTEQVAVCPWNRRGIEHSALFARPPRVSDCTLRDGEQQAGLVFRREDKVALARRLDAMGVHDLELGTPAISDEDRLAIEEIVGLGLRATLSALARATRSDIDLVASCGVWGVRISLPISERQRQAKLHSLSEDAYLRLALEVCGYAKERGLAVIFSPYDTTRCTLPFLERVLTTLAREQAADRIRLVDTAGAATPEAVGYLVGFMRQASGDIPIEVHCHDDLGLAVANTIAGALAGAAYLSVTVNGLGERAGNAALEEVVTALRVLYGVDLGLDLAQLTGLSREVEARSGVPLQAHKGVVGTNAFRHETGMVVAGVLEDPYTAEAYAPELVGQARSIVLGKKSGRGAVDFHLRQLGLSLAPAEVDAVLAAVKAASISLGRSITGEEFARLVAQETGAAVGTTGTAGPAAVTGAGTR